MASDKWAAQKWKRDLEEFLKGRKCPMCTSEQLHVAEEKVGLGPPGNLLPSTPHAQASCEYCGYTMLFVIA